jgi:hypothetical protein
MIEIAIIGSGLTGLACGRALAQAGLAPVIFDKGRGVGGRMATRRAEAYRFDHAAQILTAEGADFAAALRALVEAGAAAAWTPSTGDAGIVGVPGMSSIAAAMAASLDVRQGVQVTALGPVAGGWSIQAGEEEHRAARVIVTVPAPQVEGLLGGEHALAAMLADVRYEPCLTLMAAVDAPAPFTARRDPGDALSWIALDSSKPGRARGGPMAWVAQAGAEFSAAHLDETAEAIAARMLPLLLERIGATGAPVAHASAHRWRYATVAAPLGRPFLRDATGTLHLGGDWCLGATAEAAWRSGRAIAADVLERMG